ncbi:hypothetical protein HKX48_003405 [Thoreauomyces humboldtii]|nr:hypothetical protein HKX48_003405 [Thoreauomyces humboldtii]
MDSHRPASAVPTPPSASTSQTLGDDEEEEEDPYITRIKRSGCFPQHEALQDCHFEKKDWRACKAEMTAFRKCYEQQQRKESTSQ